MPEELSVDFEPELEVGRVNRGGSWILTAGLARAEYGSWNRPGRRHDLLGFRLARNINHEGEQHEKEG